MPGSVLIQKCLVSMDDYDAKPWRDHSCIGNNNNNNIYVVVVVVQNHYYIILLINNIPQVSRSFTPPPLLNYTTQPSYIRPFLFFLLPYLLFSCCRHRALATELLIPAPSMPHCKLGTQGKPSNAVWAFLFSTHTLPILFLSSMYVRS